MSSAQQQVLPASQPGQAEERVRALARLTKRLHINNAIASGVLWTIAGLVGLLFIAVIVKLVIDGIPSLVSPTFYGTGEAGIAKQLFNTFYILILAEVFLFPVSLAAAIYLV